MPTIITTHAYLRDGLKGAHHTHRGVCRAPQPDPVTTRGNDEDAASGEKIFQTLVRPYPQVFMVLNGHYHDNGRFSSNPDIDNCPSESEDAPDSQEERYERRLRCDNGEYRQESINSAGSEVYEMLANYQSYENGGNGWLRVIKFLPGEGENGLDRIKVETYSPDPGRVSVG